MKFRQPVSEGSKLHIREIEGADVPALITLLARGFPKRSHDFWVNAFDQLKRREQPSIYPKMGYLMEHDGAPVGCVLVIGAEVNGVVRGNTSSWYVEPQFRGFGTMLTKRTRREGITHLNVTPADHTMRGLEAQGFVRYVDGVFMAMPLLSGGEPATVVDATQCSPGIGDPKERTLLLDHAFFGCLSLWVSTNESIHPFVFRWRTVNRIPCMQLIYCRDVKDFIRFAQPLGRFLARRGYFLVMIDATGPVLGLTGKFFKNKMVKYFKGSDRPRLGDLAYTEIAIFGG